MLDSYVGQRDALAPLITSIEASRVTGRPLPHSLFLGPPGAGKTTLAKAVAVELGVPSVVLNCASVTEKTTIADAAMKLSGGGLLILDEIHSLDRKQAEALFSLTDEGTVTVMRPVIGRGWAYAWMETAADLPSDYPGDFTGAGLYEVPVPMQTKETAPEQVIVGGVVILGCTTDEALLPPALLSRLSRLLVRLRAYNLDELATIADDYAATLGLKMDGDAAVLVAQRSRQSPRRVKQLTERASDYAVAQGMEYITAIDVEDALRAAGVDSLGLESPHRALLRVLDAAPNGLSRTSLGQRLGLPPRNVELYFGELAARDLVTIDTRHRITDAGRAVLA